MLIVCSRDLRATLEPLKAVAQTVSWLRRVSIAIVAERALPYENWQIANSCYTKYGCRDSYFYSHEQLSLCLHMYVHLHVKYKEGIENRIRPVQRAMYMYMND